MQHEDVPHPSVSGLSLVPDASPTSSITLQKLSIPQILYVRGSGFGATTAQTCSVSFKAPNGREYDCTLRNHGPSFVSCEIDPRAPVDEMLTLALMCDMETYEQIASAPTLTMTPAVVPTITGISKTRDGTGSAVHLTYREAVNGGANIYIKGTGICPTPAHERPESFHYMHAYYGAAECSIVKCGLDFLQCRTQQHAPLDIQLYVRLQFTRLNVDLLAPINVASATFAGPPVFRNFLPAGPGSLPTERLVGSYTQGKNGNMSVWINGTGLGRSDDDVKVSPTPCTPNPICVTPSFWVLRERCYVAILIPSRSRHAEINITSDVHPLLGPLDGRGDVAYLIFASATNHG